ncbi:MAG: hypothetical protein ABIH00_11500 [Armatimonadota bacterium]
MNTNIITGVNPVTAKRQNEFKKITIMLKKTPMTLDETTIYLRNNKVFKIILFNGIANYEIFKYKYYPNFPKGKELETETGGWQDNPVNRKPMNNDSKLVFLYQLKETAKEINDHPKKYPENLASQLNKAIRDIEKIKTKE